MKTAILKMGFIFLFLSLTGAGCEDNENNGGEWIKIGSLTTDVQLSTQLDVIFSEDNECLQNFQEDTLLHTFFTRNDVMEIDNCNTIPEIDFDKYTLIGGKIMVSSISDQISAINLTSNDIKGKYKIEVSIYEPDGRYAAIGYFYFWRLYPKLESKYQIELSVDKKK
jgi:hypothetical protein